MVLNLVDNFFVVYRKENFDFNSPIIQLYDFHPQLLILLAINGQFTNNKTSLLRFAWPFVGMGISICAFVMEIITTVHAISTHDFQLFTETFAYSVILGIIPTLYVCTFWRSKSLLKLMDNMNKDFLYVCSLGEPYRKAFLDGQLNIWQSGVIWLVFNVFVMLMYIGLSTISLLYHCLILTQDEHSVRPLIFPLWLPKDDPTRTPNFEIFTFCSYLILLIFEVTFMVYVYLVFHILLHSYVQLDMIIMSISLIFKDMEDDKTLMNKKNTQSKKYIATRLEFNRRFRRIATWHNAVYESVDITQSIYAPTLVYQINNSAVALCLMAYQVAEQLDNGIFDLLFIVNTIATTMQLWIPCHLGSLIRNKGLEVADAAFTCGWHETSLGTMVRSDIQLIIARAQKPITIQVKGIPPLNLETFSSIMSASYTYFNMLRKTEGL